MNRRTYRWPSGGCPKLQPPRNGIDYSISIKIRGLRAVLSNAPSDTPQTRGKPGGNPETRETRGNPGETRETRGKPGETRDSHQLPALFCRRSRDCTRVCPAGVLTAPPSEAAKPPDAAKIR